jgi:hypothetical protein
MGPMQTSKARRLLFTGNKGDEHATDWYMFKMKMKAKLNAEGVLDTIKSAAPTEESGSSKEVIENYHINDATAVNIIMEAVEGSACRLLEYLEPVAFILWQALENRFDQNDDERRGELNRLLWSRKAIMTDTFDVDTHYTDHLSIISRLESLGTSVSSNDSRSTFMNSLPHEFDVLASAIITTDMAGIVKQLTSYHRKQQLKKAAKASSTTIATPAPTSGAIFDQNVALATTSVQQTMLCHICKRPGHFARECPIKTDNNGYNSKYNQSNPNQYSNNNQYGTGINNGNSNDNQYGHSIQNSTSNAQQGNAGHGQNGHGSSTTNGVVAGAGVYGQDARSGQWCTFHRVNDHSDHECKTQQRIRYQAQQQHQQQPQQHYSVPQSEGVVDNSYHHWHTGNNQQYQQQQQQYQQQQSHDLMSIAKDIISNNISTQGVHENDMLWFADSAASVHMVDSALLPLDCFSDITPLTGAQVITGGNTILPAVAKATYNSLIYLSDGNMASFSVSNVLMVPGLGGHLFSISTATQRGVKFMLSQETNIMSIGDTSISLISGRGLYVFRTRLNTASDSQDTVSSFPEIALATSQTPSSAMLWHRRLLATVDVKVEGDYDSEFNRETIQLCKQYATDQLTDLCFENRLHQPYTQYSSAIALTASRISVDPRSRTQAMAGPFAEQ